MIYRILAVLILGCLMVQAAGRVPRPSGEFAIQLPGGRQELLTKHRGKVVVIEFLYTTCPHCQHTSQLMNRFQADYGPKGFQALATAFNEMANMLIPDFIRQFGVSYPLGWNTRESVLAYLQISPLLRFVVPQMVIVDRSGVIRAQSPDLGDSNFFEEKHLRAKIESLLREPVAKKAPAPRKKSS